MGDVGGYEIVLSSNDDVKVFRCLQGGRMHPCRQCGWDTEYTWIARKGENGHAEVLGRVCSSLCAQRLLKNKDFFKGVQY